MAVETSISERRHSLPRIPISRYPLEHSYDGIRYEVHKVTPENMWDLRRRVLPFEKEFGYGDSFLTHDKVRRYIREGGEVVFARTPDRHPKDVGVVTQEMKRAVVDGQEKRVLSIGIRVVVEDYQKHSIGRHLAEDAIIRHRPDAVTGQFRTWRIPRIYQGIRFISGIAPIDGPLTDEMQEVLKGVLDKSTLAVTDLRTGLCLGVFPSADSKRFIPPITNARGMEINIRIRALGAQPERGDAIRYYAPVDQEAVEAAIASGYITSEVGGYDGLRAIGRLIIRKTADFIRLPHSR